MRHCILIFTTISVIMIVMLFLTSLASQLDSMTSLSFSATFALIVAGFASLLLSRMVDPDE